MPFCKRFIIADGNNGIGVSWNHIILDTLFSSVALEKIAFADKGSKQEFDLGNDFREATLEYIGALAPCRKCSFSK